MAPAQLKPRSFAFFAALLFLLLKLTAGLQHTVGGSEGWTIPAKTNTNYSNWQAAQTFVVGDSLYFNYSSAFHDVMEVTQADYDACNASDPIETWDDGATVVPLNKSGTFFFICGVFGHCEAGQKLSVKVMENKASLSTSPSPSPSFSPMPSSSPATMSSTSPSSAPAPMSKSPSPPALTTAPSPSTTSPSPSPTPSPSPAPTSMPMSPSQSPSLNPTATPSPGPSFMPSPSPSPSTSFSPPSISMPPSPSPAPAMVVTRPPAPSPSSSVPSPATTTSPNYPPADFSSSAWSVKVTPLAASFMAAALLPLGSLLLLH